MLNIRKEIHKASRGLGSKVFLNSILEDIESKKQVIDFIHRYGIFNGDFAGGVANLAGAFHIRGDIFKEKSKVDAINDKSSEIATEIYFAAEDEYFDRDFKTRVTHRQLAQELLKASLSYFKVSDKEFKKSFILNKKTKETIISVRKGYCLNKKNNEEDLFKGLGFHIGSELLADQEFNVIDNFLKKKYPKFVKFLKTKTTDFKGIEAYRWISLHTIVELEHLDHAFTAAEKAIKYYKGKRDKKEIQQLVVQGFLKFSQTQRTFFNHILDQH